MFLFIESAPFEVICFNQRHTACLLTVSLLLIKIRNIQMTGNFQPNIFVFLQCYRRFSFSCCFCRTAISINILFQSKHASAFFSLKFFMRDTFVHFWVTDCGESLQFRNLSILIFLYKLFFLFKQFTKHTFSQSCSILVTKFCTCAEGSKMWKFIAETAKL